MPVKKRMNVIFSVVFVALLLLPLATMNFKSNEISEIDNEYLPEIEWVLNGRLIKSTEEFVNARFGFREEILDLYQNLNAKCFGLMEHPSYMYGKDGHVFFKRESYIKDYQHLDLDAEWAADFVMSMRSFSDYARSEGMEFIYLLIPDKKTVYPEYLPDEIYVKGELSRTDQVLSNLERSDMNWIWAKDVLMQGKERQPVFNRQYDAGHWNEDGAFLVYQRLYEEICRMFPEVEPLSKDDYDVDTQVMESLSVSRFRIHEEVPRYTLKSELKNAVDDNDWAQKHLFFPEENSYYNRFVNPAKSDKPKLLVFHDSYMMADEKFFLEHFSEVTFIHRSNLLNFEVYKKYLDIINPDLVIYENPERAMPITFHGEYPPK